MICSERTTLCGSAWMPRPRAGRTRRLPLAETCPPATPCLPGPPHRTSRSFSVPLEPPRTKLSSVSPAPRVLALLGVTRGHLSPAFSWLPPGTGKCKVHMRMHNGIMFQATWPQELVRQSWKKISLTTSGTLWQMLPMQVAMVPVAWNLRA